ncbi:hypothetical protein Goari_022567 [Gossypium aridum]|uniref:DUF7745 domain-containing protein n=1 Tax=Gossypium aridum TaxID=34290 RepID=A0A7J8YNM0_GOSAI|nr:hypothetical protein [Gossypium aridum]
MVNEFLNKVEDNAAVRIWSEKTQLQKGDSLTEGYVLELWEFTRISMIQNHLQKLEEIWGEWDDEIKQLFYCHYGMSEQWIIARIKQKGNCRCISWKNLKDLILAYPDMKKRVDIFTLSIYGLVVFPKALGYVDEAVSNLFDQLDKRVTPVPVEKVFYRVFSEDYSPLKELVATPRQDDISEEKWLAILQNLQDKDIEWKAPWMLPNEIMYRCGNFDWVPLLGI